MRQSIHRLHGIHRLHPSDVLLRFSKRKFFRILQLRLAFYRFDLITVYTDKLNAIFALNPEKSVFAGPKHSGGFDHSPVVKPLL
jgi:hypothetical protein